MRFALVLLFACGPRESAPVDYGPPPQPIDPISCPASTLEKFAARLGATITIASEPLLDAARTDKLPCKPAEADDACITRARTRPVPAQYEVIAVKIGGGVAHVDFTYDIDGRRVTEQAESMEAMVARIKALQARGHKVTLIRGESAPDAGSRHAAISYRGVGGRLRRVATVHVGPDGARLDAPARDPARVMEDARALADEALLQIRSMDVDAENGLVIVMTCGNA